VLCFSAWQIRVFGVISVVVWKDKQYIGPSTAPFGLQKLQTVTHVAGTIVIIIIIIVQQLKQ
jgi:hypothetical protein